MTEQILLIYDGECGFCRWSMHALRRLDRPGVFGYCPFGHPIAESHLSMLSPERRYSSFHAVRNGVLSSATEAARVALEALPLGRLAVMIGLHRLYPIVAGNRALFGRLVPNRSVINTCRDVPADVR